MIYFHERMLRDPVGIESNLQPPDYQSDAHIGPWAGETEAGGMCTKLRRNSKFTGSFEK